MLFFKGIRRDIAKNIPNKYTPSKTKIASDTEITLSPVTIIRRLFDLGVFADDDVAFAWELNAISNGDMEILRKYTPSDPDGLAEKEREGEGEGEEEGEELREGAEI